MNPTAVIAVALGLAAAYVVSKYVLPSAGAAVGGGGDPADFQMVGQARFWKKELAPKLAAALGALKATKHTSVADVWMLGPTGEKDALALAKEIQASGSVVATSPNLLEPAATPKAMSRVTAAALMTFADKSAAILPTFS